MELADSYENLNAVPPEQLALYVEKDGKAVLDLTQTKSKGDFDRYATALRARLADATGDLKTVQTQGMTREEIMTAITEAAAKLGKPNGDARPGKQGDGDPELEGRVHDLERELKATKDKLEVAETAGQAAKNEATSNTIKNTLTGSAVKTGVRPEAVDSLVELVAKSFEVSGDGGVVTKLEGKLPAGVTPNSDPEAFFSAVKRAPEFAFFWPGSKGGGATPPGGGGAGGDASNPWSSKGWNLTEQAKAVRADRTNAEALAKQAGSFIGATKPAK